MVSPMSPDLITATEAAVALGKSRRSIARLLESGRLVPAMKLPGDNGAYLFNRSDVDDLLARAASGEGERG